MGVGAMPPVGVQGTESPLVGLGDEAPPEAGVLLHSV